jgi:hypothetical protein
VSARFIGVGLLSIGGLVVGAGGSYLALRPDVPTGAEVQAAAATPAPAGEITPGSATAAATPLAPAVVRVESTPVSKVPVRTKASPARRPETPLSRRHRLRRRFRPQHFPTRRPQRRFPSQPRRHVTRRSRSPPLQQRLRSRAGSNSTNSPSPGIPSSAFGSMPPCQRGRHELKIVCRRPSVAM